MSIEYLRNSAEFILNTDHSTYAFSIHEGKLYHRYWGARITDPQDLPTVDELKKPFDPGWIRKDDMEEYRPHNCTNNESTLKLRFADGTRDTYLEYKSHVIDGDRLEVVLKEKQYPVEVILRYRVYAERDIIERNSIIRNLGDTDVVLEHFYSANWHLPRYRGYRCTWLTGRWGDEFQISRAPLPKGELVLETRTGLSGPDAVPFFMIDEGSTTEDTGGVYFFSLEWSGNWRGVIANDVFDYCDITGGISPYDTEWCLEPGQAFETPVFLGGYTTGGFGHVSRIMHDYERQVIMAPKERDRLMPVLYNAYGTYFAAVNEERVFSVVDKAQQIGVELLVIDAGWAGEGDVGTKGYNKGMGDWTINRVRFPNGLKPLADELHRRGMMFGLWMEPESVNPGSNLAGEHPEWIAKYDGRSLDHANTRWILNFANDEAADYITARILDLIRENDLDYFKIDFNTSIAHLGWQNAEPKHQKEARIRYVRNLYRCYQTVKDTFPDILFENCSSGGRRVDLGMLRFSGRINRSDDQDTLDMIAIHEGFSTFMLPKLAGGGCHISDVYSSFFNERRTTMRYQAHASMLGSMAIGRNLNTLTDEETEELRSYTQLYKEIRGIVALGDFYRLVSLREHNYAAYEAVSKDQSEGVVFVFGRNMQFGEIPNRLRLRGLDPDAHYRAEGIGVFSGSGLMTIGMPFRLKGDFQSQVVRLFRAD